MIKEKVGLRPCRPAVRLERDEDVQHGTKTLQVFQGLYLNQAVSITLKTNAQEQVTSDNEFVSG